MDITFRLNRLILGESMLVPREIVKKTERLDVIKPCKVQIREQREIREHGVRTIRNIVDPGPNAPKLIRLIRHPYAQEVTRPQPGQPWRQPRTTAMKLEPFGETVREAFKDSQRVRWPRATRSESGLPKRARISEITAQLEEEK